MQCVWIWGMLHYGELRLSDSNSWMVKSSDFLPMIYRDQYVTSVLSAKGNLKEVFMLYYGLCEICHLWVKTNKATCIQL